MGARDWLRWLGTTPRPDEQKAIMSALPIVSGSTYSQPRWRLFSGNEWRMENASETGYEASSIVKACVDKVSVPLRSVPWRVSTLMEDPEEKRRFYWEMKGVPRDQRSEFIKSYHEGKNYSKKSHLQPLNDHPLEQLIMNPNPFFTGPEYLEMSAQHLLLGGNALFFQNRNSDLAGGRTTELWLIPPDEIEPQRDRERWVKTYFLNDRGTASPRPIPASDIMHMKLPNPRDPFWGISPLKSAATSVDTDIEAVNWNKVSLQNRAVTSGVFTFEKGLPRERWEEARQQVADQHQGVDNVYAPWVLGGGAKWQQISLSPVEMDFIKSRSMTRDDVSLVFGIDPRIHGAGEQTANREAIREIWRLHWLNLLLPFLDRYDEMFNKLLVPEYPTENLFVWYDTSNIEPLREADIDKARVAKIWWSMGVPVNMINERWRVGLPPVPGGDIGFLPASAVTVDRAIIGDTRPASADATNLDTAPDGGDNITQDMPDMTDEATDVMTGVTAEVGAEGMKNLPDPDRKNGHAETWHEDEVEAYLREELLVDDYEMEDEGNFFAVKFEGPLGPVVQRFYHGGRDLMLAAKRRDWGWHD